MARAAEYHLVAGFTQAETAELLGESKAMVQQRIAFFLAWARLALAPEVEAVARAAEAIAADPRLGRGREIAEAARRHYVGGASRDAIAAALGVPAARVEQDLRLFAAWVAAREAKRARGRAVTSLGADLVVEVALKHEASERPRIVAELCGGTASSSASRSRCSSTTTGRSRRSPPARTRWSSGRSRSSASSGPAPTARSTSPGAGRSTATSR